MSKISNPTKVITGVNTRWSYANVWDAKSINGGTPKYSVSLIIPKSDTVTVNKIKAAIAAAYEEGQSKLKGNGKTVPALSVLKTPLRDGDLERPDDPAYADAYFINANSATAPGIVDADRQLSLRDPKCIPAYTAEPALTFMPSTAMETRELPAVSTISRRFVTANLSAVNLVQKMISQLMMRRISSTKNHTTITAVGQTCCQFEERYGDNL